MGSLLGNYIHYNASNYIRYGTFRRSAHWTKKDGSTVQQQSNFSTTRFREHKNDVVKLIEKLRFSPGQLKQLETEYNIRIAEQAKNIQELRLSDPQQYTAIIDALIRSLGKSFAARVTEIIQNLTWNDKLQTYVYKGAAKVRSEEAISAPPPYTIGVSAKEGATGRGQSAPRIKYCSELIKYIKDITGNSNHPDIISLKNTQRILYKHALDYLKSETVVQRLNLKKKKGASQKIFYDLPHEIALEIDQTLLQLRGSYLEISKINETIQATFAEFIGNSIGKDLSTIAIDEIVKMLDTSKNSSMSGSGSGKSTVQTTITMDSSALKEWQRENKKSDKSMNALSTQVVTKYNKVVTDFYATLGSEVSPKADIKVQLTGGSQSISIKNTNMAARETEFTIPHVKLQPSALALYLTAIQRQWPDLGNHYLNMLTEHPSTNSPTWQKMHQEASEALTLYILYSALSGQGQLRTKGFANIFAVYDKSSYMPAGMEEYRRVKFFDMADIIMKAQATANGYKYINPPISAIKLKNEWAKTSTARITKVLMQARTKTIVATLSTEMLRNLYV